MRVCNYNIIKGLCQEMDENSLTALNARLEAKLKEMTKEGACFPPSFDNQTAPYQLAWVQRKIPQLKQEIGQLEKQLTDLQKDQRPDDGLILTFFNEAFASGPAMQLQAKKDFLDEVGQLKAECAQVCSTITDQFLRDQIEQDYDDRIRKKYQQITKL